MNVNDLNIRFNLIKLRKSRGFSQDELSSKITCLNLKKYQAYEEGRNEPNIKTLIEIANFYNTTIEELIFKQPLK